MKDHQKFRVFDTETKEYLDMTMPTNCQTSPGRFELEQCIGVKDQDENLFYIGDIGEFDNGDRFALKMEDWLEVYVDWIGEPKLEDQARDLYRIGRAKLIGNIRQNPELLN